MTNRDKIVAGLREILKDSTQIDYSRQVGIGQPYISTLLSGRKLDGLTLGTLEKLFPDLLILPFGNKSPSPEVRRELAALLERLAPGDQRRALNILKAAFPADAEK